MIRFLTTEWHAGSCISQASVQARSTRKLYPLQRRLDEMWTLSRSTQITWRLTIASSGASNGATMIRQALIRRQCMCHGAAFLPSDTTRCMLVRIAELRQHGRTKARYMQGHHELLVQAECLSVRASIRAAGHTRGRWQPGRSSPLNAAAWPSHRTHACSMTLWTMSLSY